MKTEFCFSDELVKHVLCTVECEPEYVFTEKELAEVSAESFVLLKQNKFLTWRQYDYDTALFFSSVQGDQCNPRYLRKRKDGKYWANPEEDDEGLDRILIEERDIPNWVFDIKKVIGQIRQMNKLEEPFDSLSERIHFIGSKDVSGDRVGIFLALYDLECDLGRELLVLPNSTGKYARYIVISPSQSIESQKLLNSLNGINISHLVFSDVFDDRFAFRSGLLFSEAKAELPQSLRLTGRVEAERHIVVVDNQEGGLTDANFMLLLELTVALKTTDEGWLQSGDGNWQSIGRLKNDFKRTFDGLDFEKFIVNGRKKYRLVIPSEKVTYDRVMLKKIKGNAVIANLADRLPIIRRKASKSR